MSSLSPASYYKILHTFYFRLLVEIQQRFYKSQPIQKVISLSQESPVCNVEEWNMLALQWPTTKRFTFREVVNIWDLKGFGHFTLRF